MDGDRKGIDTAEEAKSSERQSGEGLHYGLTLSNAAMVIANTASLLFGVTTILFALRFRSPQR